MNVQAKHARYWDVVAAKLSALVFREPLTFGQQLEHGAFWAKFGGEH